MYIRSKDYLCKTIILIITIVVAGTGYKTAMAQGGYGYGNYTLPEEVHDHTTHSHHDDAYWAEQTQDEEPFVVTASMVRPAAARHEGGEWGGVIRWPHTPVSIANLPNGMVLTYSGSEPFTWPTTEQTYSAVWDPITGNISEYFNDNHNMFCSDLVSLSDGRILVNGGRNTVNFTSIFDPATNSWSRTDAMNNGRWYPTSIPLPDGGVFTAVGRGNRYPEIWHEGEGWQLLTGADLQSAILDYGPNKDGAGWWPLMHLDPRGKILHYGATPEMHVIDPTGNGRVDGLGSNNLDWFPEENVAIQYDESHILIAGGARNADTDLASAKAAILDMSNAEPSITIIDNMNFARQHANEVMLPNGDVLVIGGTTTGKKFSDDGTVLTPEVWNPQSRRWTTLNDMTVPRNYHSTAILLPDGRVLAAGGGYSPGNANHPANHPDGQVFSPPYLFNQDDSPATRPRIVNVPSTTGVGSTLTVNTSEAIARFTMIRMSATTHTMNTGQRFLEVAFSGDNGVYQLTMHNNENVLLPGYWMLFALNSQGVPSEASIIQVRQIPLPAGTGAGHIVMERWDNLGNQNQLSLLTQSPNYPDAPDLAELLPRFEIPSDRGDGYGTRVRGYLHAPISGQYRFWLASDDHSELWLSTDGDPANGRRIASVPGWTDPREWDKFGEQRSALITLEAGQRYYIETLHKEGQGLDNLAVAWQIPGYNLRVIDGDYLSPLEDARFISNLALGKTATQISTYNDDPDFVAGGAVDGDLTGDDDGSSMTHTKLEDQPWWEVDLGDVYDLRQIVLWNRTDCCSDRLVDISVFVSDGPFNSMDLASTRGQAGVTELTYPGAAQRQTEFNLNRTGRYVRVQLAGRNFLQLAEVQVFGYPIAEVAPLEVVPIIAQPQQIDTPVTYFATAAGGRGTLRYEWLFGDNTPMTMPETAPSIAHTYAAPGRYIVTLKVTDESGQEVSTQFNQAIYLAPTAQQPRHSSSLALENRNGTERLWVANPDNDTVSVFNTGNNRKVIEIDVGDEPRSIAIAAGGRIWVTNQESATITRIRPGALEVLDTINLPRGSKPYGLLFDPAGSRAFVVLEGTGRLLELNVQTGNVEASVDIGPHPRHLAINSDGSKLYVSRFITPRLPGEANGVPETEGVGGEVVAVDADLMEVITTITLAVEIRSDFELGARGVPNYLGAPVISPDGSGAWIPSKQDNILRGGFRDNDNKNFEHTVRAISSRINLNNNVGAFPQEDFPQEDFSARIDHDNAGVASAAVYGPNGNYLFVALETSQEVAVVDNYQRAEVFRFSAGLAPQALALSQDGLRLFVHNFMARTVGVYDLTQLINQGELDVPEVALYNSVETEALSPQVLRGKQLFHDAKDSRLSLDSYLSCASCHNDGGHDGRIWDFTDMGEGLRNTISLEGRAGPAHGRLHWSSNFDEVHDFEQQIRGLAGGTGLMRNRDFNATSDPLGESKAGYSQDLDALAAYVNSLTRVPESPYRAADGTLTSDGVAGRRLFRRNNCAECHGGPAFTDSATNALHDIGTLKASSGNRLGGNLPGIDTPTLWGVWSTAPYLHDGSAGTIGEAINAHNGVNLDPDELNQLVAFLRQIDQNEPAQEADTTMLGDVNCDSQVSALDALFILQYDVGMRVESRQCPLADSTTEMHMAGADANGDGGVSAVDALWIMQCDVGIANPFCGGR